MYHYGGLYADLDVYALKPFDQLLQNGTLFLAMISTEKEWEHNVPNAWMASIPHHPFWLLCMAEIVARAAVCQVKHDLQPEEPM